MEGPILMATRSPPSVNYWPRSSCARAFWGQHGLPPYRELLAATSAWLDPRPGERWLDLGCGRGKLTEVLWQRSAGEIGEVVGLDCAAANVRSFDKLRARLEPPPSGAQVRFVQGDFGAGLSWPDKTFHGVVSGLAIQYAESYSEPEGWTSEAYDRALREVHRVLRPGGRFVFSVNVPEPAWSKVALGSLPGALRTRNPLRFLKKSWQMMRYGGWLKREARRGRFHYLPLETVTTKLAIVGFEATEHCLSFAGQAYLIRCRRPR